MNIVAQTIYLMQAFIKYLLHRKKIHPGKEIRVKAPDLLRFG